jgi:hypothetical protein
MDGATIQQRILAGRGKAAQRIGLACNQFRPLTAAAPLGNQIGVILAAFNAGDSTYRAPNLPGDPIWYADFDGRQTLPGDYLVRQADGSIWYVASLQQLLPIVTIECNRRLRITRENAVNAVGAVAYSGKLPTTEADILGAPGALWPASILQGGKKDASAGLPAGVKNAGWKMLLPPSVPVLIEAGDIATDDLGRRYAIDSAELTDQGWRIAANEVHT